MTSSEFKVGDLVGHADGYEKTYWFQDAPEGFGTVTSVSEKGAYPVLVNWESRNDTDHPHSEEELVKVEVYDIEYYNKED